MMNNISNFNFLPIWFFGHMLFCLFFLVGLVLLVIWAAKNLKKDDLRTVAIWLLAIGTLGSLLTMSLGTHGFGRIGSSGWSGYMMGGYYGNQMFACMQDEDCYEEMEDFMLNRFGIEEANL